MVCRQMTYLDLVEMMLPSQLNSLLRPPPVVLCNILDKLTSRK